MQIETTKEPGIEYNAIEVNSPSSAEVVLAENLTESEYQAFSDAIVTSQRNTELSTYNGSVVQSDGEYYKITTSTYEQPTVLLFLVRYPVELLVVILTGFYLRTALRIEES